MEPVRRRLIAALALGALGGPALAQRAPRRVAWFAVGDPETVHELRRYRKASRGRSTR